MQSCECCNFLFFKTDLQLSDILDSDKDICAFCQAGLERLDEIWKVIPEFPQYLISLSGKIRTVVGNIRSTLKREGYDSLTLSKKVRFVHRLLLQTYRPNPEKKPMVDHIDGKRENNLLTNLRWATEKENSANVDPEKRGCVSVAQCDDDGNIIATFPSLKVAGEKCNVAWQNISKSLRKGSRCGGYIWKYADGKPSDSRRKIKQEQLPLEHRIATIQEEEFPNYLITPTGCVYSTSSKVHLKPKYSGGYPHVSLSKDGVKREFYVHRLTAFTYLDPPKNPDQIYVNHKNGDRSDCGVSNLEWCTASENTKHAHTSGSFVHSETSVCQFDLDGNFIECFPNFTLVAKKLGKPQKILYSTVTRACKGRQNTSYGFKWAYTEDCEIDENTQQYIFNRK